MASARLVCPFDGRVVVDGAEPTPGTCPGCRARYAGGGTTPPEAVERALAHWSLRGHDAAAVARRLFDVEPGPDPEPALAITSDSREGFYLWWLFSRGEAGPALTRLMRDAPA